MHANAESIDQIKKLNREWMASYVKRDTAFLERHLSEDYVSTFPDGTVLNKRGEIDALTSGTVALMKMEPLEMNARVYGDTAVITGQSLIEATVNGQDTSGAYRFTDVWVKQGDRWQAVASQVTRIANP